ncbi:interferon lambda-3 [Myotis lucifugus]|uniref:interferon lambda-3 n=1 Tax=Myotis lucifugus TaxID=59463 RepID=UPI000CCC3CD4|nr:interferon lambda-3 [Myotis lucifugus]
MAYLLLLLWGLTLPSSSPTAGVNLQLSSCGLTSAFALQEESLLLRNRSCSSRPLPRTRDLRQLQVWERPVALEAELALTLKVLGTVANSTLGDILDQPLRTLRHIHSKLQACVPAQSTAGPRPRGRLRQWLHRLQEAEKKESRGCLEASVTLNLFRLLVRDLRCVADGDLCV